MRNKHIDISYHSPTMNKTDKTRTRRSKTTSSKSASASSLPSASTSSSFTTTTFPANASSSSNSGSRPKRASTSGRGRSMMSSTSSRSTSTSTSSFMGKGRRSTNTTTASATRGKSLSKSKSTGDTQAHIRIDGMSSIIGRLDLSDKSKTGKGAAKTGETPSSPSRVHFEMEQDKKEKEKRSELDIGALQTEVDIVFGRQRYKIKEQLGRGSFGVVYGIEDLDKHTDYALKIMEKESSSSNSKLKMELKLMKSLHHPNIVELIDSGESRGHIFMVLELLKCEIMEDLVKKTHYCEADAASVIRQVVNGLIYLHNEAGVVHRDLKPQNIMLTHDDANAKICDFGLSAKLDQHKAFVEDVTGTPLYLAPEVFKGQSSEFSCDMWSLGVICFQLLTGELPFPPLPTDKTLNDLFSRIETQSLSSSFEGRDISKAARSFIEKLIVVNPTHRYTAKEAAQHPWLSDSDESDLNQNTHMLPVTVQDLMRSYMAARRLKKSIFAVFANVAFKQRMTLHSQDHEGEGESASTVTVTTPVKKKKVKRKGTLKGKGKAKV